MAIEEPLKLDPTDIEARGVVRARGLVVSRVGVLLSLYFLEGYRKDKREALAAVLSEYVARYPGKLTHYQRQQARKLTRFHGDRLPDHYETLPTIPEEQEFSCHMIHVDPKEDDDPSLYRIRASSFAKEDTTRRLSGLKAHFPPSDVLADPDAFVDLVRRWSLALGAAHGSAGLGVLTVPGRELTDDPFHHPLLLRYPALEYDSMGSYWSATRRGGYEKPRSSNWLTILGAANTALVGGVAAIRDKLAPDLTLTTWDGGVLLRAGRLPAIDTVPEAYRAAARIIKPIRYEGYDYGVIKVADHLDGLEETLKWVRRFD